MRRTTIFALAFTALCGATLASLPERASALCRAMPLPSADYRRAIQAERDGRYEDAALILQRAALYPGLGDRLAGQMWWRVGRVALRDGRFATAVRAYERASSLQGRVQSGVDLIRALAYAGRPVEALARAAALAPSMAALPTVKAARAVALADLGRRDEARLVASEALRGSLPAVDARVLRERVHGQRYRGPGKLGNL